MKYLKNGFKHFLTICKHRSAVFYFGRRLGIGRQCILHDISKFHPVEFFESLQYYTGNRSPIDVCKEINGYSRAWLHHKGANPHHYEYWQDNFDRGGEALDMPAKYKLELICDYLAAGSTYGGNTYTFADEYKWWMNKSSKPLAMHKNTKDFVEKSLSFMSDTFSQVPIKSLDDAGWSIIKDHVYEFLKL